MGIPPTPRGRLSSREGGASHEADSANAHLPAPQRSLVVAFVPYIAMSIVHVVSLMLGSALAQPTKLTLMPLLAFSLVYAVLPARTRAVRFPLLMLLTAILFSWLGDGAGIFFPWAPDLVFMLLFFGLAHIAYMAVFARSLKRRRFPWWALIYAAWWVAMVAVLGPLTGGLFFAIAAYGLVLAGTAALATRCHPLIAVGGAFFLASDSILALRLFLPYELPSWDDPVIMATYTLGQGLIIAGAALTLRRRRTT